MNVCFQLFTTFFTIGAFTLGGGYAMLDMIERAVVTKKKWISKDEFWNTIAVAQSLPGVFAVNTALYVGHKTAGMKGAVAACFGAVIPSIAIILIIAACFADYKDNAVIERIFKGIRPCVIALILSPAIKMIKSNCLNISGILIAIMSVALICYFKISPVYIILLAIIFCTTAAFISKAKLKNKDFR